jgi:hypothetical protein
MTIVFFISLTLCHLYKALIDPEPFMNRCKTIVLSYVLDSSHHGKDVSGMLLDQSPVLHFKIKDGHLYKTHCVILQIPDSVCTIEQATAWLFANLSDNAPGIAYRKDMPAVCATHAMADGGYWFAALRNFTRKPQTPVRHYIDTNNELFENTSCYSTNRSQLRQSTT